MIRFSRLPGAAVFAYAGISLVLIPRAMILFSLAPFPPAMMAASMAFGMVAVAVALYRRGWRQTGAVLGGLALAATVLGLVAVLFPLAWWITGVMVAPSGLIRRLATGLVQLVVVLGFGFTAWNAELDPWLVAGTPPPLARATAPQAGDHLLVERTRYTHHGIYCGDGSVVHYTRDRAGILTVERTPLAAFARGGEVKVQPYAASLPARETVQRALARVGEQAYELFSNNCEHLVVSCKTGTGHCSQIEAASRALGWGASLTVGLTLAGWCAGRSIFASPARRKRARRGQSRLSHSRLRGSRGSRSMARRASLALRGGTQDRACTGDIQITIGNRADSAGGLQQQRSRPGGCHERKVPVPFSRACFLYNAHTSFLRSLPFEGPMREPSSWRRRQREDSEGSDGCRSAGRAR